MANIYTWTFPEFAVDAKTGKVLSFAWELSASDGKGNYEVHRGVVSLEGTKGLKVIPFEKLTADVVQGWVENEVDVAALKSHLDVEIDRQLNPPIKILPPPWTQTSKPKKDKAKTAA